MDIKWLNLLKKGDEVIIVSAYYNSCPYSLHKVDAVGPSGFIMVGGKEFSIDGWEKITASDYGRCYITKPTSEILETIGKIKLQTLIRNWISSKLNVITLDQLNQIRDVLKIIDNG